MWRGPDFGARRAPSLGADHEKESDIQKVKDAVRAQATRARGLSDAIAELAEPGFEEFESARLLMDYLRDNGFRVETPWKQIPTAFRAVRGKGRPAIGILGEYDALPNCGSQGR